jgi:CO/xanthine dehydrogenase Mo-binding subunit
MTNRTEQQRNDAGGVPMAARGVAAKTAGVVEFLSDRAVPGCLWAAAIRSPYPRAEVAEIDLPALREAEGVVDVCTWADVPDRRFNPALIPPDEIGIATRDKRMLTRSPRHVGDAVAVVVARTRQQAYYAARTARVTWAPSTPVLTLDEAIAAGRIAGRLELDDERATERLAAAALTVRHEVEFASAQHTCLETPTCIAAPGKYDGVEIWSNTQCPSEVRRQVAEILGRDPESVRSRKVDEGGGFGAKQDLYDEALAAWLALRIGAPVGFRHTRDEELSAGRVRSGGRIEVAMGFDADGRLLATQTTAVLDAGAYASHTPYVLSCLPGHVAAVYPGVPHAFRGAIARTDTIPAGAYRGYGVAEANLAVEQAMDMAAARLGIEPGELRRRNVRTDRDGRGIGACLDALAAHPDDRRPPAEPDIARGRGLAVAAKHSIADRTDASTAEVTLRPGPVLVLTTGTCDSGTGSSRVLARIVAEELGAPLSAIRISEGDTAVLSDIGSTAQRSVFVGGESARQAAAALRAEILSAAGDPSLTLSWPFLIDRTGRPILDINRLVAQRPLTGRARATAPGKGASYGALSVDVAVDLRTGAIRVERADAAVDCGRVLDENGARGQVIGGIVQGLGLALSDAWIPGPDGRGPATILEHGVPRASDAPEVSVTFLSSPAASGLGELPIVPVAAAIASAVADATGVRLSSFPARPQQVWRQLRAGGEQPC